MKDGKEEKGNRRKERKINGSVIDRI